MKKVLISLCLFVILAFVACSHTSSPKAAAEHYLQCLQKGQYYTIVDEMYYSKLPSPEEKENYVMMLEEKQGKSIEKKGGISSYEITKVDLSSDETEAYVSYLITYGNGESDSDNQKMVKRNGEWRIDSNK